MRFRPSALFPLVFSSIAFALVLVLVLSGTNPGVIPDGYLLSVSQEQSPFYASVLHLLFGPFADQEFQAAKC